jgi:hypothetical protein
MKNSRVLRHSEAFSQGCFAPVSAGLCGLRVPGMGSLSVVSCTRGTQDSFGDCAGHLKSFLQPCLQASK